MLIFRLRLKTVCWASCTARHLSTGLFLGSNCTDLSSNSTAARIFPFCSSIKPHACTQTSMSSTYSQHRLLQRAEHAAISTVCTCKASGQKLSIPESGQHWSCSETVLAAVLVCTSETYPAGAFSPASRIEPRTPKPCITTGGRKLHGKGRKCGRCKAANMTPQDTFVLSGSTLQHSSNAVLAASS